jgi:hypothetical protein
VNCLLVKVLHFMQWRGCEGGVIVNGLLVKVLHFLLGGSVDGLGVVVRVRVRVCKPALSERTG